MTKPQPRPAGSSSAQLAFKVIQRGDVDLCLWLHTATNPAKWEWEDPFAQMEALVAKRPAEISKIVNFVISDGGTPGAAERTRIHKEIFEGGTKISVITISLENPLKRGIATAISWLTPSFKAFEPKDVNRGLGHLGLPEDFRILDREYSSLERLLPPNETLRLARIAAGILSPDLKSSVGD